MSAAEYTIDKKNVVINVTASEYELLMTVLADATSKCYAKGYYELEQQLRELYSKIDFLA